MKPPFRFLFALLVAAGIAVTPGMAAAAQQCGLKRFARMDMTMESDGRIAVPMNVEGRSVMMMIDTGGYVSDLTPSEVGVLGLTAIDAAEPVERGFGGRIINKTVDVPDVDLGGLKAPKLQLLVGWDFHDLSGVAGTLAPDILRNYDVDFDFAHASFSLFSHDHCEGQVVYWTTGPHGRVAFKFDDSGHIAVPVLLDGHEIRAIVDTGATDTIADLERVEDEFDIEKSPDLKPLSDTTSGEVRYPFKSLIFDDVAVANPDIRLIPEDVSRLGARGPTMIIGMNVLRHLHLYVAYSEKVLYVTPATAH